ncbi:MAG TPA: peptidoglycan-binding domain-containing protein [Candidatus Paceibacterota bacterium]|nr:peptidoglycan-binding domain-containing protein [Candidatus Paceibacterota bacterium]
MSKATYGRAGRGVFAVATALGLASFLFVGVLGSGSVALATTTRVRNFSVTIAPTTSLAGATQSYTVTFNNSSASTEDIKSATIDIPYGWTVSDSSLDLGGDASSNWDIYLDHGVIKIKKHSSSGNGVQHGHSFTALFSATAPNSAGTGVFNVLAYDNNGFGSGGGAVFTLTGSEPQVVVSWPPENTLAACSDGIDNDHNGKTDLDDPGCAAFLPKLTITKVVVNDGGGTKSPSDFTFRVCETREDIPPLTLFLQNLFGVRSASAYVRHDDDCVTVTIPRESDHVTLSSLKPNAPGEWYQVSEVDAPSDYTGPVFTGGDCNTNGKVHLGAGDVKSCQLTNTYVPPPCEDQVSSQTVVSDDSNTIVDDGSASSTWVHPNWTSLDGATWIWSSYYVENPTQQEVKTFQKTFTLSGTVTAASLQIAADNLYAVNVNGTDVPVTEDPNGGNFGSIATYTLTPSLFYPGVNTLRFTVTNLAVDGSTSTSNPAGLLYKLKVTNNACIPTVKVHIIKYLDGEHASVDSANEYAFLMHAFWNSSNLGSGTGDYTIGPAGWGGSPAYEAYTSPMNVPADYATNETLANGDNGSLVLSPDAQCVPGKYRLIGYGSGDTLDAALAQQPSPEAPTFTGLTTDKYIVVRNETCPLTRATVETDPATIIATSTATFNGLITPNGDPTDWYFEYGLDSSALNNSTTPQSAGDGSTPAPVAAPVNGLTPNTHYFFRVAGNSNGATVYGSILDFWTDAVHNTGGGDNLPPTGVVLGTSTTSSTNPGGGNESSTAGQVLGASTCNEYIVGFLGRGWKNDPEDVKRLQQFLNQELGLNIPITGIFGQQTEDAVRQFQLKYHGDILKPWVQFGLHDEMTPTGFVYKTTRRWINMIECQGSNLPMPQLP